MDSATITHYIQAPQKNDGTFSSTIADDRINLPNSGPSFKFRGKLSLQVYNPLSLLPTSCDSHLKSPVSNSTAVPIVKHIPPLSCLPFFPVSNSSMSEVINHGQSNETPESTDVGVQGNADWIGLKMQNSTGVQFKIVAVKMIWGKVYSDPNDKDSEIDPKSLVGKNIDSNGSFTLYSCGRNRTTSGTEGTVTIGHQGTSNISIYWNVPYTSTNVLTPRVLEGPYWVNVANNVPKDGPIGNITVEFGKKATQRKYKASSLTHAEILK